MIKASDYIFEFFNSKGIDTVFCVAGGAASHLLDSLSKNKNYTIIFCRHEQACAMAAEGYARIANKPAIVLVTNGPGSTNAITGVLGAYQDSIPMIVLSGQVPINQTMDNEQIRQLGVQECDIISIVKSITKFSKQIRSAQTGTLKYDLILAYFHSMDKRKGPVWLDIPLNIQNYQLLDSDINMNLEEHEDLLEGKYDIKEICDLILKAKRPLIVAGNGIHLSQTEEQFHKLLSNFHIPVVTTWNAKDLMGYNHYQFIGSFGILGERAGNFAVQNADLLLILGSRLSIPNIGYDSTKFAPNAIKIMVDVDRKEIEKKTLKIDYKINEDLKIFFDKILKELSQKFVTDDGSKNNWYFKVGEWKRKYPVYQSKYANETGGINSFYFIEELSKHLTKNHIVITDMGTAFTCTMQAIKMNGTARLFTSSGTSSMGYGLPAAIGAWVADPSKEIILIAGDGGFQMNIQELQTVQQYKIPLKIFILNNNGYSAISLMQDNLFGGNYVGSTAKDVSAPNFVEITEGYLGKSKDQYWSNSRKQFDYYLPFFMREHKTCLYEIIIPENQPLYPRVQSSKNASGNIISNTLDNMYPFLSEDEMKSLMK